VTFTAERNTSQIHPGPGNHSDGSTSQRPSLRSVRRPGQVQTRHTPMDNAIVVWHSDKTEIMNSGRPPQDGDFCMDVWKRTGKSRYKLNHFAWGGNDTTNTPSGIGNPTGPTRIVEEVTLSPDGNHYVGTFTLDATDTSGTPMAHIIGVITATRVTDGATRQ